MNFIAEFGFSGTMELAAMKRRSVHFQLGW